MEMTLLPIPRLFCPLHTYFIPLCSESLKWNVELYLLS